MNKDDLHYAEIIGQLTTAEMIDDLKKKWTKDCAKYLRIRGTISKFLLRKIELPSSLNRYFNFLRSPSHYYKVLLYLTYVQPLLEIIPDDPQLTRTSIIEILVENDYGRNSRYTSHLKYWQMIFKMWNSQKVDHSQLSHNNFVMTKWPNVSKKQQRYLDLVLIEMFEIARCSPDLDSFLGNLKHNERNYYDLLRLYNNICKENIVELLLGSDLSQLVSRYLGFF